MPGELSLIKLLSTLKINCRSETFVFMTLPYENSKLRTIPLDQIHMTFREEEGLTIIVEQNTANSLGFGPSDYTFPSRMLTCEVHSSLEAVGFMAAMSKVLAEKGIGCNPVSGYYHDHLFIPVDKAEDAIKVLERLAQDSGKT